MSPSSLPGTLVGPEWLVVHLDDPDVQVVDIRGYVNTQDLGNGEQRAEYVAAGEEYLAEHIPGSTYVDWTLDITDQDCAVKVQLAKSVLFSTAMSERGVGDATDVVIVDHTGGHFATRLWWALKYYGHDRAAVLDGGFNRWKALGLPLTQAVSEPERRQFTPRERGNLRVDSDGLLAKVRAGDALIVDARDPGQYSGAVRRGARGGHVPSAVNIWAKSLFADDGTWKKDEELQHVLAAGGVKSGVPVITYCNGGVTATAILFALDRIGHGSWANYDGSWNEWGERPELPVVEGSA